MKLSIKLAYAAPSVGLAGLSLPLLVYLPTFYATQGKVPLVSIGLIFLVIRLLDIGWDPVVGAAMDRTRPRFGRFRFWLAVGAPLLSLAVWFLFNPPAGSGAIYLASCLLGVYAAWSICFVAQLGWGGALASSYEGRNALFAWWQGAYLLGSLIIAAIAQLPEFRTDPAGAVGAMGWFIMVAVLIGVAIALAGVPEPVSSPPAKVRFSDYLRLVARPAIARLLAVDLLMGMAVMTGGSLFFFYFGARHGFSRPSAAMLFFVVNLGSLVGAWAWGALGSRLGKQTAACAAFCCYAVMLAVVHFAPIDQMASAVPIVFLFGATVSAGPVLVRSMLADVGDQEELASGVDHKGLIAALFANSNKLGTAIGPALAFLALAASGFAPTAPSQTGRALTGLFAMAIAFPAVLGLLSAWLVRGHSISRQSLADIQLALAQSRLKRAH